jgi:threonine synthase
MSGAQAAGCSPIVTAWETAALSIRPVRPNTIAKSLAIGNPADGYYALGVMGETGGHGVAVDDDEIVDGILLLARTEGIFAETAGGVVISGLKRLVAAGRVGRDELVVAFITGAGLKTQEAVMHVLAPQIRIEASIASFEHALGDRLGSPTSAT